MTYSDAVQLVLKQPTKALRRLTPERWREYLTRHGWHDVATAGVATYLPPQLTADDVTASGWLTPRAEERLGGWPNEAIVAVRPPSETDHDAWFSGRVYAELNRYATFVRVYGGNRLDSAGPFNTGSAFAVLIDILATTEEP